MFQQTEEAIYSKGILTSCSLSPLILNNEKHNVAFKLKLRTLSARWLNY